MRAVDLHLRPDRGAFPGLDTALRDLDGAERDALLNFEWLSDGTYTLLYRLSAPDADVLRDLLDTHDQVRQYDIAGDPEEWLYAFVHVTEREGLSRLLDIVEDNALLFEMPFEFTDEGVRVTVAGEEAALQSAFAQATDEIEIDVEATSEYAPDEQPGLDELTDRQYEALVAAHELGYYETPRSVSFEEVAEELDCVPSTANELLRRAEAKLVSSVLSK